MGDDEQHPIEAQLVHCGTGHRQVSDVDRIEGPAEDAGESHRAVTEGAFELGHDPVRGGKSPEKDDLGLDSPAPTVLMYPIASNNTRSNPNCS